MDSFSFSFAQPYRRATWLATLRGGARRVMSRTTAVIMSLTALCLPSASYSAAGDFDTDFGSGFGKVVTAVSSGAGSSSNSFVTVLVPGGKIVTVGLCLPSEFASTQPCFARYTSSGSLDSSFNGTGTRLISAPPLSVGTFLQDIGDAVVRSDGKLVAAFQIGDMFGTATSIGTLLVRLNPDGSPDASFGPPATPGVVLWQDGQGASSRLVLLPDGRMLGGGSCGSNACVVRLNEDGSRDLSYGVNGIAALLGSVSGQPEAMQLLSNGKLLVGGSCDGQLAGNHCVARLLANGSSDSSFAGGAGVVSVVIGSVDTTLRGLAVQANGSIVTSAICTGSGGARTICMGRLAADGNSLDPTFSVDGRVNQVFSGVSDVDAPRVVMQADGRIVLAAGCKSSTTGFWSLCAFRFNADGSTDSSFGVGGRASLPISNSPSASTREFPSNVLVQPDGKLLIGGVCQALNSGELQRFCLARVQAGPQTARHCSLDIDGDGAVTLGTDALLHARIAAGMTGSAVTGGIVFPATAARKTWSDIRSYLVDQCGLTVGP